MKCAGGSWAVRLARLVLIVACSALLLEMLVRLGLNGTVKPLGFFPDGLLQFDTQVGSRNRPGRYTVRQAEYETVVHINAQGFRAADDFGPSGNRPVVAFLGDSFTEAIQVPESVTFVEQIEADMPAVCRNYGVLGHGTANALAIYRHDVRPHRPRVVVLTMFANDPRNCSPTLENSPSGWRPAYRFGDHGEPVELLDFAVPADDSYSLAGLRSSRLGRPVWEFLRAFKARSEMLKAFQQYARRAGDSGPTIASGWLVYEDPWPPEMADAVALMDWCLQQLASEVSADGSRLIACYIPALQEIRSKSWDELVGQLAKTRPGPFDRRRLERHLSQFTADEGIPFIDCYDGFIAAERAGQVLHFPNDRHLTPEGHTVVARELAPLIHEALETQ